MPPATFVFDRLIAEVERRVGIAISRDEIEAAPLEGPKIVSTAVKEVFGEPNTKETLLILMSVEEIDDLYVDMRSFDTEADVKEMVGTCLKAAIDQRLKETRISVAAVSFAAGFGPVADRLVSLAETAVETFPGSPFISADVVAEVREALERVLDKNGTRDDLETVLRATEQLRGLLMSPKDKMGWKRHGIDYETTSKTVHEFKLYKEMLGLGWNNGDEALKAISNRAASELRPNPSEQSSSPRP